MAVRRRAVTQNLSIPVTGHRFDVTRLGRRSDEANQPLSVRAQTGVTP